MERTPKNYLIGIASFLVLVLVNWISSYLMIWLRAMPIIADSSVTASFLFALSVSVIDVVIAYLMLDFWSKNDGILVLSSGALVNTVSFWITTQYFKFFYEFGQSDLASYCFAKIYILFLGIVVMLAVFYILDGQKREPNNKNATWEFLVIGNVALSEQLMVALASLDFHGSDPMQSNNAPGIEKWFKENSKGYLAVVVLDPENQQTELAKAVSKFSKVYLVSKDQPARLNKKIIWIKVQDGEKLAKTLLKLEGLI
jgi:hypothetical protein